MFRKKTVFFIALIVVSTFFLTLRYLLTILPGTESEVKGNSELIQESIYSRLNSLPDLYRSPQKFNNSKIDAFLNNIRTDNSLKLDISDLKELWQEVQSWPSKNQLANISSPNLGKIMFAMKYTPIISTDIDSRGTQLKILLNLQGDQQVVFKPKWYSKDKVIEGPVYAGKDRYGSEIVAFYLSVLLDKPLTPLSVERTLSLKNDILPVATKRLFNTSFERSNKTCIYGRCFYCKKEDPICEKENNLLTGAVIFNIKKTFSNYRSPWQRTYKKGKKAPWEDDLNYCKIVRGKLTRKRIFDLVDTAIFDFLIQNGDRHHYETLDDTVVWIDNGKGLGNPYVHHLDILAPLYQCCIIKEKMWKSLLSLRGGNLRALLKLMPDIDNFLTEAHLKAMEERLLLIFAAVEYCKHK